MFQDKEAIHHHQRINDPTAGVQAFVMVVRLVGANDWKCSREQRLNVPSEALFIRSTY
jgi:hypothetical protein